MHTDIYNFKYEYIVLFVKVKVLENFHSVNILLYSLAFDIYFVTVITMSQRGVFIIQLLYNIQIFQQI
jgi:hypothetical protein